MASPHPSSFTSPAHHSPTDFGLLSHPYPHHLMLPDDALLVASPAALRSSLYRNALPRPWPADSPGNDSLCPTPDPDNSFGVQRTMDVFGQSYLCSFQSSSNAGHIFTNDRPAHFPRLINSPPSSNASCTLSNMQGKLFDPPMHGGADVAMALRGSNAASRPCSASNKAEHLQPIQHQIEPLASATASRTNSLNEESVVIDQTGSHASSPNGFANNYPFDPGFAEQARRSLAFTSLENYPTLIDAVAMDDLRKACETPCVSQSVVETSDTYLLATALATPSRWLPSPIPDSVARRAASFAMASADAKKVAHNPKLEALSSEDSFPNGAQIDKRNDCNKLEAPFNAPLYASGMPQTRQRLHEIDHRRAFVDETRPIVRSTEVFNAAPKDFTGMKKRRLEMEASVGKDVGLGNLGESKISDPLMESSAKRQISTSQAKGKEKSRAKQKRGGRDSSMDTNPREENSRKSAEESRQEFVYVRARCGLATDSHSLAERVRREKLNKRMRFLQDLVPGCGKITGKLKLLDEIINYVQSLQHHVEFLCMKLAARSSTVSDQCEFEKPCMGQDKLLSKFYGAQVGAMSGRLWRGGDLQLL